MVSVNINSVNYEGKSSIVTFYPYTGGTINLGLQIIPFDYVTEYYYGTYEMYFEEYSNTCVLDILPITPTPTPTVTNTPTPTMTNTPTPTPISCSEFTFIGNNATTTINSATKTSAGGWDSSAYSVETYTNPVTLTFQTSNNGNYLMGGFSYNPTGNIETYTNTTYGLYIQPGFLEIYENGGQVTVPGSMTNLSTDVWKVIYNGTNVTYYKNDVLIYTSSNPVTQPLHIFFPLLIEGEGVTNVCVIGTPIV